MSAVGNFFGKATGAGDPAKANVNDINSNDFNNRNSQGVDNQAIGRMDTVTQRQAPTAGAATVSAVERTQGARIAPNERSAATSLGPAAQASDVGINRQDEQFRNGQASLASQLQAQANGQGPSLAGGMLRQNADRSIAQQMAVTAAQGGNPALAQRNAAIGAAQVNRQAGSDAAQMRIQEQQSAQQQLGNVLSNARNQDIGVNTSQAGLTQGTNLANQAATNQFGLAQGQMNQQNQQFNAGQANATNLSQAQFNQQSAMGNADAYNKAIYQNAAQQQQANLANQNASLQQQQLNDQAYASALKAYQDQGMSDVQARAAYQQLKSQQNSQLQGLNMQAAGANADKAGSFLGGAISGLASAAAASDEAAKVDLMPLDSGSDAPTIATSQGGGFDPDKGKIPDPSTGAGGSKAELKKSQFGSAGLDAFSKGMATPSYGKGNYQVAPTSTGFLDALTRSPMVTSDANAKCDVKALTRALTRKAK